jgi:protein-S-isoprenylcysteine O-methyltransferase Ste14
MVPLFFSLTVVCWVIFLVVILGSALFTKRTAEYQDFSGRIVWGFFLLLAAVLMIKGVQKNTAPGVGLKGPVYPLYVSVLPHWLSVLLLGLAITTLGLACALWARITLGGNWSGAVTYKEDHELIQRGPYALARHPIYTGMLLMFTGMAITVGSVGGLLGIPALLISCWIKLKQEEALMIKHFPEVYPGYKQRVKALIPYIF